ncbi:hypothetical protein TIFTF001_016593 [Ficus carica]|uniref:Uncharacterized protein n=1 Tax=Ficus carica TaxID=3494 RepID=A0AA88AJU0_FICCA|nr:hypothetical protein TIFTF001_016593 [Ficus carica]
MDWRHVGPNLAQGTGGWLSPAPAGAGSARGATSTTLPEYVVRSSETARVGRIIIPGRTKSGSRPDSEQTGTAFPLSRVVGSVFASPLVGVVLRFWDRGVFWHTSSRLMTYDMPGWFLVVVVPSKEFLTLQ